MSDQTWCTVEFKDPSVKRDQTEICTKSFTQWILFGTDRNFLMKGMFWKGFERGNTKTPLVDSELKINN